MMPVYDTLVGLWDGMSTDTQDATVLALLLLPTLVIGMVTLWGFAPWPIVVAIILRHRWIAGTFAVLIAVSVGLGIGITSQERALREGTARAAEKFDLIVAAPGSEVTMTLAAVYLQPSNVALLDGDAYEAVSTADNVALAAPIAFGDAYQGAPVVGTTPQFILHLASGALAEGKNITQMFDAVAGAETDVEIGDLIEPTHGIPGTALADENESHGVEYKIVGRLPPTGSPWDKAYLVSVESVWDIHGLANGHGADWDGTLGPPFDASRFPGTPAIMVRAEELWATYALRSAFQTEDTMAFFPGAVLARLHAILGDIRSILSLMAVTTQVLVTIGVLVGLIILTGLLARRLALLRAIGAPRRFVFAITWSFAASLILVGAALGLGVGLVAAQVISSVITARTDILVEARIGWTELHALAGFVSLTTSLALLPAWTAATRPLLADLRG